jgi:hypothetical protein
MFRPVLSKVHAKRKEQISEARDWLLSFSFDKDNEDDLGAYYGCILAQYSEHRRLRDKARLKRWLSKDKNRKYQALKQRQYVAKNRDKHNARRRAIRAIKNALAGKQKLVINKQTLRNTLLDDIRFERLCAK